MSRAAQSNTERYDEQAIVEGVVARAVGRVLDPPSGVDPVVTLASPGELVDAFASTVGLGFDDVAPASDPTQVLAAVDQIVGYSVQTSHPRFVNQNFAGPDPIGVVGDWLGAALNTTGATFEAAPVFTLMESAVIDKLGRLAGYVEADGSSPGGVPVLPPGLFCAGGSLGLLMALQLARHRHQPDVVTAGSNGDRLALFVSDAGHYGAGKSAAMLGIGSDGVVEVATDHEGALRPADLEAAIDTAMADGRTPFAVIGTAGTTVTSAFDPLDAIADICQERELWFHVDGCYGGSALFSPSQAWRLRGLERSDSCVWNLHKMIGMTQQCTALLVKDPTGLAPCFATNADYLFQPDKLNGDCDSGDRTFQCARRIDVLKLWLTWKARGDAGFAARIDHAVAMADHTRKRIDGSGGAFVPVVSGDFTNVVFVWVPARLRSLATGSTGELDLAALTEPVRAELHGLAVRIKGRMQAEGSGMIGYQPVHGMNTFRMICVSPELEETDVDALLEAIDRAGEHLAA